MNFRFIIVVHFRNYVLLLFHHRILGNFSHNCCRHRKIVFIGPLLAILLIVWQHLFGFSFAIYNEHIKPLCAFASYFSDNYKCAFAKLGCSVASRAIIDFPIGCKMLGNAVPEGFFRAIKSWSLALVVRSFLLFHSINFIIQRISRLNHFQRSAITRSSFASRTAKIVKGPQNT